MVYNQSKTTQQKKPRIKVEGKLIGLSCNSEKMKIFDPKEGKYSWLSMSIVIGHDDAGQDIYRNVTAYDIKMSEMPALEKADKLLKDKKRPRVSLECYEAEVLAKDKVTGQPITEEITEIRNGKEVLVMKQKIYKNYRMSDDDIKKTFKILADNIQEQQAPRTEEEIVGE
jgi:glucose dehydrogenase